MAAHDLTLVPLSEFPQVHAAILEAGLNCEIEAIDRLVSQALARVHLTTCDYESEWCDCFAKATVHQLATEREFCLRHFQEVERWLNSRANN